MAFIQIKKISKDNFISEFTINRIICIISNNNVVSQIFLRIKILFLTYFWPTVGNLSLILQFCVSCFRDIEHDFIRKL